MVSSVYRIAMIQQLRPRPPCKWHVGVFVPPSVRPCFPVFDICRPIVASQLVRTWSRQPISPKFTGSILSRLDAKNAAASRKLCSEADPLNRAGSCSAEASRRALSLTGTGTAQPEITADPLAFGPSSAVADADSGGLIVEKNKRDDDGGVIGGEQQSSELVRACSSASSSSASRAASGRTHGASIPARQRKRQADQKVLLEWYHALMDGCKKPVTRDLIRNLAFSNLLGINESYRNGSLKDGTVNSEILKVKKQFPHEVVLCRVGEFYECVGFDACLLVEYAGLNPMGGRKERSVPRAGCPVANLRMTLEHLTARQLSCVVMEEVQEASANAGRTGTGRKRKGRFVAGHAHPGSPYVFGLAAVDEDMEFPEPVPVVGIAHESTGYLLVSAVEMTRSFTVDRCLTEEAVVAKLRAHGYLRCFIHASVLHDPTGIRSWREHGTAGLLFSECQPKGYSRYDGHPVDSLLMQVRDLFDLHGSEAHFTELKAPPGCRPAPLYVSTATHIGILPSPGVPSLLHRLLSNDGSAQGLCLGYLRSLLLHPPPPHVAHSISDACQLMLSLPSLPSFPLVAPSKLVKLLLEAEANTYELLRLRSLAGTVLAMHREAHMRPLLHLLLPPTHLASGIHLDADTLAHECLIIHEMISDVLICDDRASASNGEALTASERERERDGGSSEWGEDDRSEGGGRATNGAVQCESQEDSKEAGEEEDEEKDEEDDGWGALGESHVGLTGAGAGMSVLRDEYGDEVSTKEGSEGVSASSSEGSSSDSRFSALRAFFSEMEQGWRGRVQSKHLKKEYEEVERAARAYEDAVASDLSPFVDRSRAIPSSSSSSSSSSKRVELAAYRDHGVLLKGKAAKSMPLLEADPLTSLRKQLQSASDGKGKRIGEGWLTTAKVDAALADYKCAVSDARLAVVERVRAVAGRLRGHTGAVVTVANLSIIARTLDSHVRCCASRGWTFASLHSKSNPSSTPSLGHTPPHPSLSLPPSSLPSPPSSSSSTSITSQLHHAQPSHSPNLHLPSLIPYWLDSHPLCSPVPNTVDLRSSLVLLTGPNGGGKSSLLRSICAAALLASCGLMLPCARPASVPPLDVILLRMMPQDAPADGKSAFQVESMELASLLSVASPRSLILVDEMCKGTEPDHGAALLAAALEALDASGCLGVVSTHFHRLLPLPLSLSRVQRRAMSVRREGERGRRVPTWMLVDGECRESLAFETAEREGVPAAVLARAQELLPLIHEQAAAASAGRGGDEHSSDLQTQPAIHHNRVPNAQDHGSWDSCDKDEQVVASDSEMDVGEYVHIALPLIVETGSHSGRFTPASAAVHLNAETSAGKHRVVPDSSRSADSGVPLVSGGAQMHFEEVSSLLFGEWVRNNVGGGRMNEGDATDGSESMDRSQSALKGVRIPAHHLPSAAFNSQSCVYMMCRNDGRYYIGETDDIEGRIQAHRQNKAFLNAECLFVTVPHKSVARWMETSLICILNDRGVPLVNKGDQFHRSFGGSTPNARFRY